MDTFDDAELLDRPVSVPVDKIGDAIEVALRTGRLDLSEAIGGREIPWDDIREDLHQFVAQCAIFGQMGWGHPCVYFYERVVPISFGQELIDDYAASRPISKIIKNKVEQIDRSGLITRFVPVDDAKAVFKEALRSFIQKRIDAFFGSRPPRQEGDDGFRGLKVTVTASTKNLQVVHCRSFFFRQEVCFGETLTSPVVGYLRDAGFYYFGTLDATQDGAKWSLTTYEIPPQLTVALPI